MTPDAALRRIVPTMGWHADRLKTIRFTGGADPVLPTPFCIGAAGAAALAATGLAASDLWELRTGRHQQITVDLRQATASLRGGRYMSFEDGRERDQQHPIMGVYPTKDGRWSYIHANFPNHLAAAVTVLGCDATPEAVAATLTRWKALDFEEALIAAKGAGAMVRSRAEWAAHPQGQAIAALPLLEIIRAGDSPPEPLPAGDRPLSGVRVLDLTRLLAGPVCGRTLAEHGAEVMKITAPHLPQMGYEDADTSHGKLSAQLDLRVPRDQERLRHLVRDADVFLQGYRPGALDARGFTSQALHALRPGLVHLSVCAFSHQGPWASRRGFDTVVQAVSGMAVRQAEAVPAPRPGPQFYPVSAIDYCSGYLLAAGAMVALKRRAVEGGSWLVRLSLAQVGKWIADLGEVPASALHDVQPEFPPADIERWSTVTDTPQVRMRHLKPVVQMSETPGQWTRPAVPLGYHQPEWPT